MQGEKIKVVIAGQSPVIRLGLVHTLYKDADVTVVREVDGLTEVMHVLASVEPDAAVIENSFAMWEAVDLLKKLNATCNVPILIVSERADRSYISSVLNAGAAGIFMTKEPLDQLVPSIRKVVSGGTYLSETLSQEIIETTGENYWDGQFGIDQLSERELQLFELMGMGYDTGEIGEKLHIGTKTVETHRRHIRQKLGSNNTSELLRKAISWVVQTSAS